MFSKVAWESGVKLQKEWTTHGIFIEIEKETTVWFWECIIQVQLRGVWKNLTPLDSDVV